jgi:hypothetical protein
MTNRSPEARVLLDGWRVDCCCIDQDVRLLFLYPPPEVAELDTYELTLRTPFTVDDGGRRYLLDPQGPRERLGPLLTVYDRVVETASVDADGALTLTFIDGGILLTEPDLALEAWELVGPRENRVVCLPRGDGVVWFRDERYAAAT